MTTEVITTHINADFDAFASVMAAKKLYPEAQVVFAGSLEKKVRDFVELFRPFPIGKLKDIEMEKVKRLIIVDTKNKERIGPFKELLKNPNVKVHIYDHHPPTPEDIRGELEITVSVGAVSTIFTEILEKKKIPLTPLEATILCLGIYEETGSMLYSSTTPRDLNAASYLLRKGANLNVVSSFLKTDLSTEEITLLNRLLDSAEELLIHGVKVVVCNATTEGFSDVAHLAHRIMDMQEADAVFLLVSMSDKVLIVGRSKASEIDAASVLTDFGGGGHAFAASATVRERPIDLLLAELKNSIVHKVRPVKLASDVMTTHVISITNRETIKEAEVRMTKYGVNVLPVLENGLYYGILTREVVEKAIFHGFRNAPCMDFVSTDVFTATVDTPIAEIESTMIEMNQRFVPVLKDGKVVGAITRTDLMRSMYEEVLKKSRVSKETTPQKTSLFRNAAKLLRERMPPEIYDMLLLAGEVADQMGMSAYMVGGSVRDLLRGEENLDIDIVIEGDGIAYATELSKRIGARVSVYKRFGTARLLPLDKQQGLWFGRDNLKIDIATARTEYYETPASLPKVEVSSIKKDLYRRDFTINTLAIKLNKKDFGELIDFFGGQRDLKERSIRTLHNLSFVEDPTRAFRAVRFCERFGFKMTKHTENLLRAAIRMNIFDKLSGTRIYDELMLTFDETNPVKSLQMMDSYGLLAVIHPSIKMNKEMRELIESVHDTVTWFNLLFLKQQCKSHILYIMSLIFKLSETERKDALKRLSVPTHLVRYIGQVFEEVKSILSKLVPEDDYLTYCLLRQQTIESILFAMAVTKNLQRKRAISHFLLQTKNTRPIIDGNVLKSLGIEPGPIYSEIFERILEQKIKGKLSTKEEEIELAKSIASERGLLGHSS